jgi:hypothetical protein
MGIIKKILSRIMASPSPNDDADIVIGFVKKHSGYFALLFVLAIFYISNGLVYDLEIREQNRQGERLLEIKAKYNMKLKEFNEYGNYQNISNLVNKHGLNLEEPSSPPIKVEK